MKSDWLIVDLDQSLIRNDLLWEQSLTWLKKAPWRCFLLLWWLLTGGKAHLKWQLSGRQPLDPASLPYNQAVLRLLEETRGYPQSKIMLASASPARWVETIAEHLKLFDHVISSTKEKNMKSHQKIAEIKRELGTQTFTYIGDTWADLPIWEKAHQRVVVNPTFFLEKRLRRSDKPLQVINEGTGFFRSLLKILRLHQSVKNLLLFLPILAAHKIGDKHLLIANSWAFFSFSFAAFFVYVLNDLLDIHADRSHTSKKFRPLASGDMSVLQAVGILPVLGGTSLICALQLEARGFLTWLIIYVIANIFYSFFLKKIFILDIVVLASMYTLRIFSGGAATEIEVSEWLLAFSNFFFFSLAALKRSTELMRSSASASSTRGYSRQDLPSMQIAGLAAGLISILIVVLYIQNPHVRVLYSHSDRLWFTTPVFLYWVTRVWALGYKDQINDDPVLFALKDKASWICLILVFLIMGASR